MKKTNKQLMLDFPGEERTNDVQVSRVHYDEHLDTTRATGASRPVLSVGDVIYKGDRRLKVVKYIRKGKKIPGISQGWYSFDVEVMELDMVFEKVSA